MLTAVATCHFKPGCARILYFFIKNYNVLYTTVIDCLLNLTSDKDNPSEVGSLCH